MIKHVVMFQFAPEHKADLELAKQKLEALVGKVPSLKHMEVGINFLPGDRAMDLVLIAQMEDEAGLEAYQVHPAHQEIVAFIKPRAVLSKTVDFR